MRFGKILEERDYKEILKEATKHTPYRMTLYDINDEFSTIVITTCLKNGGAKTKRIIYLPLDKNDTEITFLKGMAEKFECYTSGMVNDNELNAHCYFQHKMWEKESDLKQKKEDIKDEEME